MLASAKLRWGASSDEEIHQFSIQARRQRAARCIDAMTTNSKRHATADPKGMDELIQISELLQRSELVQSSAGV